MAENLRPGTRSEFMRDFDEREQRLAERRADRCWLRKFAPAELRSCDGALDPCHLIPQQLLKRELGSRKVGWEMLVVAACRKHHRLFDEAKRIRAPRSALPESVERFAEDAGLVWWLDRFYGISHSRAGSSEGNHQGSDLDGPQIAGESGGE